MSDYTEDHAGQVQPDPPKTPADERDREIIEEARKAYELVNSIEDRQRTQEDEDLEFEGVDPWLPEHRASRARHEDESTGREVPARPALTVPLLDQPIQQVISEARSARLGVTVKPKNGIANTETANYFKGLIRRIQADSGAGEVRIWALERAVKVGRGAYRVITEFANDGDFDLDIRIDRILDQGNVYWDPYSEHADKRDAEWVLTTTWISEDARKRSWPKKPILAPENAFNDDDERWYTLASDTNQRSFLVATYYKVEYDTRKLAFHPQVGSMFLDEMDPEIQEAVKEGVKDPASKARLRDVQQRRVMVYIVDGAQVLESYKENGRYLPVIPTCGKEYFVKGRRIWKGMVRSAMDVVRGYQVAVSSAVEAAGSMPRAPYIMYEGQDEGFEEMWDDAAVKGYSRLYVRATEIGGKPAPLPQRQNLEPQIQGALLLARSMKDDISSLTGIVDPAFRAVNPYDRSGKAIEAMQKQGAAGTSNYLDNLATISMMQEGRVLVDKIAHVYDRPGRVVRVMGEDNDDESAILVKMPFINGPDGEPIPVPCPVCQGVGQLPSAPPQPNVLGLLVPAPMMACPDCEGDATATKENMPETHEGKKVKYVDFSEGEYEVSVAIDRSHQTKQEEALSGMSELAQAQPEMVPAFASKWVRAMGFSGANDIADTVDRMFPTPQEEEGGMEDVPPEFMAQVQQLQQEHEAAMQQIQEMQKALETDAIKAESQKEIALIKAEASEALEAIKQQGKAIASVQDTQGSKEIERVKGQIELMRQEAEQRWETLRQQAEHQHEVLLELTEQRGQRDADERRPNTEG